MNNFQIDFIGIGVPRSGTTWVYECLKEHPEVCFSDDKETGFFRKKNMFNNINNYQKHFKHCIDGQIRGEFDTKYFSSENTATKIKETFPNVKLIIIFRNPTEVVSSYYQMRHKRGRPVGGSFSKVIREQGNIFLKQGMYANHLNKYLQFFDKKQLYIGFYDDLVQDSKIFIKEIYLFLNIDSTFIPTYIAKKRNYLGSSTVRYPRIIKLMFLIDSKVYHLKFFRVLFPLLKKFHIHTLKNNFIYYLKRKESSVNTETVNITEEDKDYLYTLFKEQISQLEDITDRDLSSWKK